MLAQQKIALLKGYTIAVSSRRDPPTLSSMTRDFSFLGSPNRLLTVERRIDRFWALGFLVAALMLFMINLGGVPLRDWDEGTLAQVARNMSRSSSWQGWLFPTLSGLPYFNKPPLVHWLIALMYQSVGISEWATRLPSALLTATSVPLFYSLGLELFRQRLPALFSTLIYLTLLPVVRHGRLAMLDGPVLCFLVLMILFTLKARRNVRYSLGLGLGLGLIALTKSILALLLGAIALLFLAWDTPRLLKSSYLWLGIIFGLIPVTLWYSLQLLHYGNPFLETGLVHQSLSRIWQSVENRSGPPWYYLLEILKLSLPWLLMFIPGLGLAWQNRSLSWGKLVLVWGGLYFTAISIMSTKLPWYVLPLYPALALAGGAQLAEFWRAYSQGIPRLKRRFIKTLTWSFYTLAVAAWGATLYVMVAQQVSSWMIPALFASIAVTLTVVSLLFQQEDYQFIGILAWGSYVSLLLLMASPVWVWELQEGFAVKPVAEILIAHTPIQQPIMTNYPYGRPSLDFYSDRRLIPANFDQILQTWSKYPQPYFLLDRQGLEALEARFPQAVQPLGSAEGWTLVTKSPGISL